MVHTLSRLRVTSILVLSLVMVAGLATTSPASAQEPGGRFRVLIPTPELEGGAQEKFAKSVANETRKLIDQMPTHRSLENNTLKTLLKQFNLKENDLNCIMSRQLATQGGVELVMCGTVRPAGGDMEVEATFVSLDQSSFEVPPVTSGDAKVVAQHIFSSFQTFVQQLALVQYCTEDLGSQQWDMALGKCGEALALNPVSAPALYGQGYALMKLERFDESLVSLRELLGLEPLHSEGLQAAGFVTAKLGQMEASRGYFNQFLELNPGNIQVRLTIALDALTAGDPEGALDIAEQGMVADAPDQQLIEYAGYFAAAAAAKKAEATDNAGGDGSAAEAKALYQKAADYLGQVYAEQGSETKVDVLVQLLNALTNTDQVDEALEFGAKAVVAKPGEASLWQAYALALREAGKTVEAVGAMDSVVALDPSAKNIRVQQAQWLLQDEKLEAAGVAFRKAVDAGELESESAGMNIFAIGINEKFQKGQQAAAVPYFELAQKFVTKPESKGMVNFFHGLVFFYRGMEVQKPETLASANAALPVFQRALELFNQSGGYGQASATNAKSLADHINNVNQFIEIQQAIIKRGR